VIPFVDIDRYVLII